MTEEEVLAEFRADAALLEGHFILSSGLRSRRSVQCTRVLMDSIRGSRHVSAPFHPLVRLTMPAFADGALPLELAAIPAEMPGSRKAA